MSHKRDCSLYETGFTLVELLVTLVIFMMVMIAVYALFDGGQWFYLHGERKTKIQEIARMAMEQMERDIRMSGFGVPTGAKFGATTRWTPSIFTSTGGQFFFRADIDNGHSYLTRNAAAGATTINVEDPSLVCPQPGSSAILLVKDGKKWQPMICTSADDATDTITINASPSAGAEECNSEECDIFTPEHIFYRLTPDADADGVCDNTNPDDDPFCEIQRAVVVGNEPVTTVVDTEYKTLATNIISMQITTGGLVQLVITARDRSMEGPQKYQDVTLTTQILIRSDVY
jgi:type II secretory pathway pseudopilin PulG